MSAEGLRQTPGRPVQVLQKQEVRDQGPERENNRQRGAGLSQAVP